MDIFFLLGNQLFPNKYIKDFKNKNIFIMSESFNICSKLKYHKLKIQFILSSMRSYKDNLIKKGFKVEYNELNNKNLKSNLFDFLQKNILKNKSKSVTTFEFQDNDFEKKFRKFVNKNKITWNILKSPMFIKDKQFFKEFLSQNKKPLMANFYKKIRKDLKILIDENNNPTGGKWSFDEENRKRLPKDILIPTDLKSKKNVHIKSTEKLVNQIFKDNPGDSSNFWLSTDRNEIEKKLDFFIDYKLNFFGDYEDFVSQKNQILFHSALSPYINLGLITPEEIINKILKKDLKNKFRLNSLEGYIRQLIGWREFMKGIYDNFSHDMEKGNFFNNENKLKDTWYSGTTGLEPLDHAIGNVLKNGWSHHIERLMILSNIMNLCEIKPKEVYKWFMEMFVDAYDWVMKPNVFSMGLFSEGGIFATKPYICGSNYFLKMMDFKKGDWCEIMDGLYWRFIQKNKTFFSKNPRLSMMVRNLEKMDKNRKENIFNKAENFIKRNTL